MIQLGWKAGTEQYPPSNLIEYACAAEKAGFDVVESSDHFHPWDELGQASYVWTWLGAVAIETRAVHIGTGVTCPILRYHPSIIAQAAATVGALAPGRVFLGVGTGEALNEYPATGLWPEYNERQEMLGEAIDLIRALWSGEKITYDGRYYHTRKAKLYTLSPEPIPIYVSSLNPNSAAFAGKHGDGLITTGGKKPRVYRQLLKNFQESARQSGKDPAQCPKMIELSVAYTENEEAALNCVKQYWAGAYIPALFNQKIYTPQMAAEDGEVIGSDILREKMCISANPEDHVAFATEYLDLGFDHLIFHCAGPDQRTFIEGYGRDVLPLIREKGK